MIVGKTYSFDAAHFIPGHEKCGEVHGHTWTLKVELGGTIDPTTHMLLDFNTLNQIVRENILQPFDHKCINEVVPEGFFPTAETLCVLFLEILQPFILYYPNIHFLTIGLREGEGGWAETTMDFEEDREVENGPR